MHSGRAGKNSAKTNGSGGTTALSPSDDVLSQCLVEARLDARLQEQYPGDLPKTLEQAYNVQAASTSRWPDDVAGWKVARLPPADRERFNQDRLAGPVFRSTVCATEAGGSAVAKIFDGGFAAIEAEIVLEIGRDIAPDCNADPHDDLASLVAKAYCGAEIASSPMPFVIELGATSIISDLGINTGVVVGPEIAGFIELAKDALTTSVSVDGNVVGSASPGPVTGTPFDALRFLIAHCSEQGVALPAGSWVSTGMITGVHPVQVGCTARVDFGDLGWFDVAFEAIGPR